mmetsp:Transcript_3141/g.2610  ORF Transcript_3141/g.2610 Transcript_3141/m.2610 type:complete len:400 (+) Transcript_3141:12-1211(+)
MEETKVKREDSHPKRKTNVILNQELQKKEYDTIEEKKLIETTLQGKNSEISEIVKDKDLRKLWISCFFNKNTLKNIEEIVNKIERVHIKLSMQNRATLLEGLGELLKKKYILTEKDAGKLLQVILNPGDKGEEEEEVSMKKTKTKKKGKAKNSDIRRVVSGYKLFDINTLLIPQTSLTTTLGSNKSSFSSKLFGQGMSDDQMIRRDDQMNSDIEKSYNALDSNNGGGMMMDPNSDGNNFGLRNLSSPDQPLGSVGQGMVGDNPSSDMIVDSAFDIEPEVGFESDIMNLIMNPTHQNREINFDKFEFKMPNESEFSNINNEEVGAQTQSRSLANILVIDDLNNNKSSEGTQKIDARASSYFKNMRSSMEKEREMQNALAFYSTDDDTGSDAQNVDMVINE